MEKISKIIPPNRRTQPIDIVKTEKQPGVFQARPSAMKFDLEMDQEQVSSALASKTSDKFDLINDKVSISDSAKNLDETDSVKTETKEEDAYKNMKEAKNAQMVERLSNRFFGNQAPSTAAAVIADPAASTPLPKAEEVAEKVDKTSQMVAY